MTTARDIVTLALKEAGTLGVGQTALSEDINDAFTLLQRMVAQWQRKRWLVPSLQEVVKVGNSLVSNKIGPGQYYNAPRPDKIQGGYIVQLNTGNTPVSLPLHPIFSYEDYIKISVKNLNSLPDHFFYDGAFPYGNVFIWPIPNSQYEVHLLVKSALGFPTTITTGTLTAGGTLYVDGAYPAVPLTALSGVGTGATADLTVAGGIITAVVIANGGEDFNIADTLGVPNAYLGGTGSGFIYTVTNVTSNLDSDIDMPPEYEEALHYNLAIRLGSMFQLEIQKATIMMAKMALQTIRKANVQIPQLRMPPGLKRAKGFSLYNPDGY